MSLARVPLKQGFARAAGAAERRDEERVAIELVGRCMISTKRDSEGKRREFACRTLDMSSHAMRIEAPVVGPVGDRVVLHFDEFGTIDGQIMRVERQAMVINILADEKVHRRLARKLAWLKGRQAEEVHEQRQNRRVVPRKALTTLTVASGETASCFVIDMSPAGVGVSADLVPPVGTVVAVGAVVGRVRRHFGEGFAVCFIEPQDTETLEMRLMLR